MAVPKINELYYNFITDPGVKLITMHNEYENDNWLNTRGTESYELEFKNKWIL